MILSVCNQQHVCHFKAGEYHTKHTAQTQQIRADPDCDVKDWNSLCFMCVVVGCCWSGFCSALSLRMIASGPGIRRFFFPFFQFCCFPLHLVFVFFLGGIFCPLISLYRCPSTFYFSISVSKHFFAAIGACCSSCSMFMATIGYINNGSKTNPKQQQKTSIRVFKANHRCSKHSNNNGDDDECAI